MPSLVSSSQNLETFSALSLFIASTQVSPPPGCHPHIFYLSDLVSPLFFVNLSTNFFLRVSPLWRVSPGAVRPPPVTPLWVLVRCHTCVKDDRLWRELWRVAKTHVKVACVTGHDARHVMTRRADARLVFRIERAAPLYSMRLWRASLTRTASSNTRVNNAHVTSDLDCYIYSILCTDYEWMKLQPRMFTKFDLILPLWPTQLLYV